MQSLKRHLGIWSQVEEASPGQEEKPFSLHNRMGEESMNVDRGKFVGVKSEC